MNDSIDTISVPKDRLTWSLFLLRAGVFIVMLMWALDKFVNPAHGAAVFENFYSIGGLGTTTFYIIGAFQIVLLAAFVAGVMKTWSYGAILLFHAVTTFSSYNQYLDAFNNLLFFAAWPMLAACAAIFLLRDFDTRFTLGKSAS